MDLSKLTPAPWLAEGGEVFRDGPLLRWLAHDSPWKAGYEGSDRVKTDGEFIALARNAFAVMMRRGWWVSNGVKHGHEELLWSVQGPYDHEEPGIGGKWWPDPFTALVEAEKWLVENVEKK